MANQLRRQVEIWRSACADFSALVEQLLPDDWTRDTDCPGWTVHDVVAHSAALESELAGNDPVLAEVPSALADVRRTIGRYTDAA